MSGKSHKATSGKNRRQPKVVDLTTAQRMLPLIERITADIVEDRNQLDRFHFELAGLDRDKRTLSWPERQRRYAVQTEVARLQGRLDEEQKELSELGAVLLSTSTGQVGFPTVINGRPAYYSWQIGEKAVEFWHFDGEATRRPIPSQWNDGSTARLLGRR